MLEAENECVPLQTSIYKGLIIRYLLEVVLPSNQEFDCSAGVKVHNYCSRKVFICFSVLFSAQFSFSEWVYKFQLSFYCSITFSFSSVFIRFSVTCS